MTLADILMSKLKQNETVAWEKDDIEELEKQVTSTMDPKVVEVYKTVGKVLKAYKSGSLPKIFKVIP